MIRRIDDFAYSDVLPGFIARGAAGILKKNYKNFDLFIPVVLENSDVTYILIQVKNRDGLLETDAFEILGKMDKPEKIIFKKAKRIEHLSLLMSLGESQLAISYTFKKDSLFYNLANLCNSNLFSKEVVKNIENLLNSYRYDIPSKKYDKNVYKMVTVGSLHF